MPIMIYQFYHWQPPKLYTVSDDIYLSKLNKETSLYCTITAAVIMKRTVNKGSSVSMQAYLIRLNLDFLNVTVKQKHAINHGEHYIK